MKKLFLLTILISAISIQSNAQDIGQMWIGGAASFWSDHHKEGDLNSTSYSIIPEFGYVISENIGLGISAGYSQSEDVSIGYSTSNNIASRYYYSYKSNSFSVAPFVRYSFLQGGIGGLFVDGGIGYTYTNNKAFEIKSHTIEIGFRPGAAFNISSKVSLIGKVGFLGYRNIKDERQFESASNKLETTRTGFGFNFNLNNILLGAIFKF